MTTKYSREGNDIFGQAVEDDGAINTMPYKVAEIDEAGELKLAKGMAKLHRAGVEAFLEASGEKLDDVPSLPVEPVAPRSKGIPPCPEADPQSGDKTPAVIAWWFKHHPAEAAARYQGRKFAMPDLSQYE